MEKVIGTVLKAERATSVGRVEPKNIKLWLGKHEIVASNESMKPDG